MVQTLGQPVAGWTKAKSLLGGGKVPLSENTKAVWAWQDRANRQRKQQMKSCLLFSLPMAIFPGSLLSALLSQSSPRANSQAISPGIFQLGVWIRENKPGLRGQWGQHIDTLLRLLRMQLACWKD